MATASQIGKLRVILTIVLLALTPPTASFSGRRRMNRGMGVSPTLRRISRRAIYVPPSSSLFPVTLPPLPLPDTGYDAVDDLAEEYVERPIDLLRKRLRDFQRTGMYELGKNAMEYAVDSMNSLADNIRCPESCAPPDPDAPEMPICGSDGRTYQTACSMKLKNCRRTAEEWRVFVRHRGECGAWTNWVVSFLPRSLFEVDTGEDDYDYYS